MIIRNNNGAEYDLEHAVDSQGNKLYWLYGANGEVKGSNITNMLIGQGFTQNEASAALNELENYANQFSKSF